MGNVGTHFGPIPPPISAQHLAADDAPEISLPDLERELESLLVKYEHLAAAPIASQAMGCYRAGNRVDAVLDRIAEIQAIIANAITGHEVRALQRDMDATPTETGVTSWP